MWRRGDVSEGVRGSGGRGRRSEGPGAVGSGGSISSGGRGCAVAASSSVPSHTREEKEASKASVFQFSHSIHGVDQSYIKNIFTYTQVL